MAKDESTGGFPIGNKDPGKRGRSIKREAKPIMGQDIPKSVWQKIFGSK